MSYEKGVKCPKCGKKLDQRFRYRVKHRKECKGI